MSKICICEYESRNFTFDGFGSTPAQAKKACIAAMRRHMVQYELRDKFWFDDSFNEREVEIGGGYRDRGDALVMVAATERGNKLPSRIVEVLQDANQFLTEIMEETANPSPESISEVRDKVQRILRKEGAL